MPIYERPMKDLSFEQLLGYAASIQYSILAPCRNKLELSLRWLHSRQIPFNAINIAGGVACNSELRRLISEVAVKYNVPLTYSAPAYCTDNASMIAWMGWELINAEQDVDISESTVQSIKKIPLGSYVEGFVNVPKEPLLNGIKKVMTRVNFEKTHAKQE
jgi:tRNA A37 threonylcarbamoyltransferase TsaD